LPFAINIAAIKGFKGTLGNSTITNGKASKKQVGFNTTNTTSIGSKKGKGYNTTFAVKISIPKSMNNKDNQNITTKGPSRRSTKAPKGSSSTTTNSTTVGGKGKQLL
jgi:hypothetical protein